ncbi:hypothetical protein [Bernardetia sp. MNP-M8]|uniref:hypothetical protein n=1 Tax=Bernardetia sp. MNP-M8 TaxID=3127470 RepID=UPI0030CF6D57
MKNIIVLLFIVGLLASCQNRETKTEENQNLEETQTSEISNETSTSSSEQTNNDFDVSVFSRDNVDMYGGVALENEEGILCYINEKNKTGEIAIGNDPYSITEININEGIYTFKGEGLEITTSKCNYEEKEADCIYGTFDLVTIKFNNQVKTFENIKLQDCSNLGM